MDNRFVIVTALYNVEKWIGKTIKSVMKQNYKNYRCVLVDDLSTDNSKEVIKKTIKDDDRFILVENEEKKCSLQNIFEAVHNYSEDEDIIVILDGDDFLYGESVLSNLNDEYNKVNCLELV